MIRKLLIFACLQCLAAANQDCNYFQTLNSGQTYYAYNSEYPKSYKGDNHCKWLSTSDELITVNCTVELPSSANCTRDSLTILGPNGPGKKYCGFDQVSIKEYGQVQIRLDTPSDSQGGRILCEIKTVKEFNNGNCDCGWKKVTRIVGGSETGVNEYTMMAGLVDLEKQEVYCGATIINNHQVITAASCVENRNMNEIFVVVGEHDVTTGKDTNATKLFRVSDTHIYPHYSEDKNDIAVVTILGRIEYSVNVGPVCLPFQHSVDSFAGQFVDVLGWGLLEFAGKKSTTLQKASVSVITNFECARSYPNILASQMCTFGPMGKDSCQMDSGGPLLWRNSVTKRIVLVGIISSGVGCAGEYPGVHSRVGAYMDWIVSLTPKDVNYCIVE